MAQSNNQPSNVVSSLITKTAEIINKRPAVQQLVIGSVSGLGTGALVIRIGKTAAFTIGGSIILFQIAQHQKLTSMDWDKVKERAQHTSQKLGNMSPEVMANAKHFGRTNRYFTAGFIGGFLIGLST